MINHDIELKKASNVVKPKASVCCERIFFLFLYIAKQAVNIKITMTEKNVIGITLGFMVDFI